MPSFQDSIFLFLLALLLFGPKRLPVLAREIGKWLAEFRRASNEFKMQMEDELRTLEHTEQQKRIAAIEAAAPARVEPIAEPEPAIGGFSEPQPEQPLTPSGDDQPVHPEPQARHAPEPLPIASGGDLRMMPPSTGLPSGRSRAGQTESTDADAVHTLADSIPAAEPVPEPIPETAHGR